MPQIVINFQNEEKFIRDVDAVAEALGYEDALTEQPNLTKQNFIERKLKEHFQYISRQTRVQKAIAEIEIED